MVEDGMDPDGEPEEVSMEEDTMDPDGEADGIGENDHS